MNLDFDYKYYVSEILKYNKTISFAESCTGGMLSSYFTDLSGVSSIFKGSIVSYSNEVKENILGVKQETLKNFGAVSKQTASEMAKGVAYLLKTQISASITGIAGPSGGTNLKPVGTVYIAIKIDEQLWYGKFLFKGNRHQIREQSVKTVLISIVELLRYQKTSDFCEIKDFE